MIPSLKLLGSDFRFAAASARVLGQLRGLRPDSERSVADALEERARREPERVAVVHEGREVTFRELDRSANRVARWARREGVGRGDVVALLMENRPEFVIAWLGLAKIGAVTALINTNLSGMPLAHSLRVSEAKHLILGAELAERYATALTDLETPPTAWAWGGPVEGARDLDRALEARSPAPLGKGARSGLRASDRLFYIYTSGTTGLPKAANFSHLRFLATSAGASAMARLGPDDRMYVTLPLYHTAGGVMALGGALLSGASVVLARRFSASRFWEDCVRYDVTVFQYIGELCRYLLHTPPHPDESRHRVRLCIGNGLRPEIWQPFQERFGIRDVVEFYGATEGNVVFMNLDNKVGSVGRLPPLVRRAAGIHLVRFDVEKGAVERGADGFCVPCGPGEVGEAIGRITALARFEGYSSPEATERKILRDVFRRGDAYFRTGDLLRADEQGYFYFVDRIGDTFRWKGENVSTHEVEEVLSACPGVREANVYGVQVPGADGRAGMAALVVDEEFDLEHLGRSCAEQLPSYARPLFLRLLPELEVTATFKHRKLDLVRQAFDPEQVVDPLYFLSPEQGSYVPLDAATVERIASGSTRL